MEFPPEIRPTDTSPPQWNPADSPDSWRARIVRRVCDPRSARPPEEQQLAEQGGPTLEEPELMGAVGVPHPWARGQADWRRGDSGQLAAWTGCSRSVQRRKRPAAPASHRSEEGGEFLDRTVEDGPKGATKRHQNTFLSLGKRLTTGLEQPPLLTLEQAFETPSRRRGRRPSHPMVTLYWANALNRLLHTFPRFKHLEHSVDRILSYAPGVLRCGRRLAAAAGWEQARSEAPAPASPPRARGTDQPRPLRVGGMLRAVPPRHALPRRAAPRRAAPQRELGTSPQEQGRHRAREAEAP